MKQPRTMLLVFAMTFLALGGFSFADMPKGEHGGKHHHGDRHYEKGKHRATCWTETLTEDQQAQVDKMRVEFKKVKSLLKAQITVKKVELATLVTQDKPDQEAINQKIDEILKLKKEKMRKKYAFKVKLRSVLNEKQRVLFDMKMLKKALHGKSHRYKKGHGHQ